MNKKAIIKLLEDVQADLEKSKNTLVAIKVWLIESK